ncbi:hypothetical protein CAOG_002622 [Capsaspora owczarzaki ATCC 30864]|uniref:Uncharacterized protein n=1 Tax=Capsaspora owczarzaki (strain ATCC 30864) TaxID=595528 RepID=A0A0D2VMR8_CAPO3|nr:hypothetical protein CAOG_002622 [Capsaspora owczarzaki ATCC 30864]
MIGLFPNRHTRGQEDEKDVDENDENQNDDDDDDDENDDDDDEVKRIRSRIRNHMASDRKSNLLSSPGEDWVFMCPEYILDLAKTNVNCPYCTRRIKPANVSLDRVNNKLGHVPTNLVLCCGPCNIARSDFFSVTEFMAVCALVLAMRTEPKASSHSIAVKEPPQVLSKLPKLQSYEAIKKAKIAERSDKIRFGLMKKLVIDRTCRKQEVLDIAKTCVEEFAFDEDWIETSFKMAHEP